LRQKRGEAESKSILLFLVIDLYRNYIFGVSVAGEIQRGLALLGGKGNGVVSDLPVSVRPK